MANRVANIYSCAPIRRILACGFVLWALASVAGCGSRTSLPVESDASSGAGAAGSTGTSSGSGSSGTSGGGGGATCNPDGAPCSSALPCCAEACVDGTCGVPACAKGEGAVALASGLNWPFGVAVDETSVYFALYNSDGAVMKVPKAGGEVMTLKEGLDSPSQLALDDANLYVSVAGSGQVLKISKDGADVAVLASGQGGPSGLAIDATHVYWANYLGGSLVNVPKSGGPTATLASELNPYRVGVGTTDLYWSGSSSGLRSVLKTGGPSIQIASGNPRTMVSDGTSVYWTDPGDATVKRADEDGGNPETLAALEVDAFPDGIAVDELNVYWTVATGQVMKVAKTGGVPAVIADGQNQPAIVAVDGSCVYWTNTSTTQREAGMVMRAPK